MRILFDQGTPAPLRHALIRHEVVTAFEQKWDTLQNGQLLDAAEAGSFDLLVTTDRNLRYQQNLVAHRDRRPLDDELATHPATHRVRREGH